MIRKKLLGVDDVIEYLNGLIVRDPIAMKALVNTRVKVNDLLCAHPEITVFENEVGRGIGLLNVLNGMFGKLRSGPYAGSGPISVIHQGLDIVEFIRTESIDLSELEDLVHEPTDK